MSTDLCILSETFAVGMISLTTTYQLKIILSLFEVMDEIFKRTPLDPNSLRKLKMQALKNKYICELPSVLSPFHKLFITITPTIMVTVTTVMIIVTFLLDD